MDQRERVFDPEEVLRMFVESQMAHMWTELVCKVISFDAEEQTIQAQPAINGRYKLKNQTWQSIQLPVLLDVPVVWTGGGGVTMTYPINANDECVVLISSRCIDNWFEQGFLSPNTTDPNDPNGRTYNPANDPPSWRMNDLSDGFAFIGPRNKTRTLASFNTTTARWRTDDNTCYVELDPVNKQVNIVAPNGINLNGVTIDSSGNVVTPDDATVTTDDVITDTGNLSSLADHKHTYTPGSLPPTQTSTPVSGT